MEFDTVPAGVEAYCCSSEEASTYYKRFCNSKYLLVNASSFYKTRNMDRIKTLVRGTEKRIIVDSGGFQIMSRDLSMSARTSFEIQRQIGDIGLILDVPPLLRENITSKATTSLVPTNSQRFFEECLKKTKQNVLQTIDMDRKDMKYYMIIQGTTFNQAKQWSNEISRITNFDGISIKATSVQQMFTHIMAARNLGYDRLHILGVSGRNWAPIMLSIIKSLTSFKTVTFDSTVALIASTRKNYFIPGMLGVFSSGVHLGSIENIAEMCKCKICKEFQKSDLLEKGTLASTALHIHNINFLDTIIKQWKNLDLNIINSTLPYLGFSNIWKMIDYVLKNPEHSENVFGRFKNEFVQLKGEEKQISVLHFVS